MIVRHLFLYVLYSYYFILTYASKDPTYFVKAFLLVFSLR